MKAPECRMYAERFPEIDQVVMVQVNTLVILLASFSYWNMTTLKA